MSSKSKRGSVLKVSSAAKHLPEDVSKVDNIKTKPAHSNEENAGSAITKPANGDEINNKGREEDRTEEITSSAGDCTHVPIVQSVDKAEVSNTGSGDSKTAEQTNGTESPTNQAHLDPSAVVEEQSEKDDMASPLSPNADSDALGEKDDEDMSPELQFDENDVEVESEGSPSRCKTRRSQTRNICTPQTPKLVCEQQDVELNPAVADDSMSEKELADGNEAAELDNSDAHSSVSLDNISTRAVSGSDATRNADCASFEDSLSGPPVGCSMSDTLRNLSPRRTIHPLSDDYRRMALKNKFDTQGNVHTTRECVERITHVKRKKHSLSPIENKRARMEGSEFPLYYSSLPSSKEKLEDSNNMTVVPMVRSHQKKRWCTIM